MEKFTPEQLNIVGERVFSDANLQGEGAKYVQDVDSKTGEPLEPRLELTRNLLVEKEAFNIIFDGIKKDVVKAFFNDRENNVILNGAYELEGEDASIYKVNKIYLEPEGHVYGEITSDGFRQSVAFNELTEASKENILKIFRNRVSRFDLRVRGLSKKEESSFFEKSPDLESMGSEFLGSESLDPVDLDGPEGPERG